MTDFVLHGGVGLLLGLLGLPMAFFLLLAFGKEFFDWATYGLFSVSDLLYGIIGFLVGWYLVKFWRTMKGLFMAVLFLVIATAATGQPFSKMTGTGAYGGLVTYSPAAQKWDQRTALQWWRLTPAYFRSAVRDSVFALSGDTAALVLGLDPYGQGTPVTIGSGLNLSAGVLTGTGGVSGTGINRYLALWTGTTTIDTADIYVDVNGDLTAPGNIYANGGSIVLTSEIDGDTTNEIQAIDSLYVTGTTLYASLSSDGVAAKSVDLAVIQDGTGTDNQTLSWNGGTGEITISGGNTIDIDGRYLESEVDGSTTNELQTIDTFQLFGSTLYSSLSSDGQPAKTVSLAGFLDNTDAQTLSFSSPSLSISNGNSVNLSALVSGYVTGSGTTGYVPYFTGSSEIGNSGLYWDNGNSRLGIGRTPTTYAQETQGKITSYGVSGASGLLLERFSGGAFHVLRDDGGNNLGIYAGGAGRVFLAPAAIQTLTAYYNGSAGLVGIGQTSPTARLHVTGSGSTSATTAFLVENASGTDALEVKDNGQVIIGATAGTGVPLEVTSSSSANIAFFKGKDNTLVYYRAGGVGYNAGFKFQTSNGVTTTGSVTSSTGTGNLEFLSTGNMSFSPATNIGIGTTSPAASAKVDITSTTKGFLPPRMTDAEQNSISSPALGLQLVSTTDSTARFFNGTSWNTLLTDGMGYLNWSDTTVLATQYYVNTNLADTASAIRGDFPVNTDAQTLSFSNPNLSISGGNSVDISALVPAYKSGHTSGTTTGGGNLSVTHSFPSGTPTVVLVTLGSTTPVGVTVRVVSISSTTFGLNFYNTGTAAALASTAVDFYWRVE